MNFLTVTICTDCTITPYWPLGCTENDLFLAKLNRNGSPMWMQAFGESGGYEIGTAIAVDNGGDIYVTGSISGSTDIGTGPISSPHETEAFVAKHDGVTGDQLWVRVFGGETAGIEFVMVTDYGIDVVADTAGDVFWTGHFEETVEIGGQAIQGYFIAKLSGSSGNVLWASSGGGCKLATNSAGDVVTSGVAIRSGIDGSVLLEGPGGCFADVAVDSSDDIVVVGGYPFSISLCKFSGTDGGEIWRLDTTHDFAAGEYCYYGGLAIDDLDDIVFAAECWVNPPSIDLGDMHTDCYGSLVAKFGSGGDYVWSECYGFIKARGLDIGTISDPGDPLNRPVVVGNYYVMPGGLPTEFGSSIVLPWDPETHKSSAFVLQFWP